MNRHGKYLLLTAGVLLATMRAFSTCCMPSAQGDETSDFVWCLEGAVNDDLHDEHFPEAGNPPSRVTVSRPSNWNRDDIRSTWMQNVTSN
ncbi:MAG: hypothetical protein OXU74_07255 [Gemmatimonadota bacterium]|nr:hypothetical protein [Gemmatimonadota bacterium]